MTDKLKLLVADDTDVVRNVLGRFLNDRFDIEYAVDGGEAVDLIQRLKPDAIVCDYDMPGLFGDEVLTWLRLNREKLYDDKTPQFALHSGNIGDRALAALALYGDGVFTYGKPPRKERGESYWNLGSRLSVGLVLKPKKFALLVVDDDRDIREAAPDFYGDRFNVACAEDGEKGLDYIKTLRPDAVILDCVMPKLNGYEVLGKLLDNESGPHPFVAFCSGLADADSIVERYGALRFEKPYTPIEICNALHAKLTEHS